MGLNRLTKGHKIKAFVPISPNAQSLSNSSRPVLPEAHTCSTRPAAKRGQTLRPPSPYPSATALTSCRIRYPQCGVRTTRRKGMSTRQVLLSPASGGTRRSCPVPTHFSKGSRTKQQPESQLRLLASQLVTGPRGRNENSKSPSPPPFPRHSVPSASGCSTFTSVRLKRPFRFRPTCGTETKTDRRHAERNAVSPVFPRKDSNRHRAKPPLSKCSCH